MTTEFSVPLRIATEDDQTVEAVRSHLHQCLRLDLDTEEMDSDAWMGMGLSVDWAELGTRDHTARIMFAREKHGRRYFDVSTDELLTIVSLRLLRERRNDGYYDPGSPPTGIQRTPEEIAALPADLQAAAQQTNLQTRRQLRQYQQDVEFLAEVELVLVSFDLAAACRKTGKRGPSYPRAFELLTERNDAEYERVEIPDLSMPLLTSRPPYMTPREHYEAERAGWAVFDVDGRDQVQRLDEGDIPLPSDEAAWALAAASGFQLDAEGYVQGRVDSQESEMGDDSGHGDGD